MRQSKIKQEVKTMATKMSLTKEQSLAVTTRGKIMVSASAGSGKTHTMLERIMHLIESGVSLRKMLILVYNEANASELREKIRQKLFEKVCEQVGETADKYRKQLDEIAFSTICTIHAFCRSAIRKNFEVLGINPDFEILDETAHSVYMKRALDQVFEEYAEKKDEVFFDMLSIFEVTRSEENLRANVIKLYERMDVQYDLDAFVKSVKSYYETPDRFDNIIFGSATDTMKKVVAVINEILPTLVATEQQVFVDRMQDIESLLSLFETKNAKAIIERKDEVWNGKQLRPKNKTAEKTSIARAKSCNDTAKALVDQIVALYTDIELKNKAFEQNKAFGEKLLEVTLRFKFVLEEMKEKDSVLSFGDLEHGAVKLIDNGVDISEDYDFVFVDEYQDVNGAQEYVISHLVKDEAFMVGDVKQSIYGFRLSDPEIFLARQKKYTEDSEKGEGVAPIYFNDNFRSDNQVLQFVNGVFSYAMTEGTAGVNYKDDASFNQVTDPERNEGRVEVHVFQGKSGSPVQASELYHLCDHQNPESTESATEQEGKYIADEIKRLMARTHLTIKGVNRPLQYGDFALLFRKRNTASATIVKQLKSAGIPVDDGTFTKEDVPAETELVNMLLVIDNPRQDYALAGFMLSYLGGYTEDELYDIATSSREGELYDKVLARSEKDDRLGEKLKATLATLNHYRVKASYQSVRGLVDELVGDTAYDAYLYSKSQAMGNSFDSYLKTIKEDGSSLSKYLREYKSDSREMRGRPEGGDKVHISTFHSYKGLETPVVFLPDGSNARKMAGSKDLNVDASGCIAMSYFDLDKRSKNADTTSNHALQILVQEKEYKEEMRLLYVALTRAQKYMYITGTSTAKNDVFNEDGLTASFSVEPFEREKTIFNYIFTAKRRGTLDFVTCLHGDGGYTPINEKEKPFFAMGGKKTAFDEELEKEIEKARGYVYPHQEETTLAMKYTVTALNADSVKDLGVSFPVYDESDSDRRNDGVEITAIGTAYHRVMELIDFSLDDLSAVTKAIDQMVADGLLREEQRALVKDNEIFKALMNPVIKSAAGEKCYHEQPFMMYVPARDVIDGSESDDKVLVQGVIDLLVRGKENVIIDFKYSAFRTDESKEKYKKQLYLYKMAYERAFREKIDKVVLLSLKTGESFQL